MATHRDPSPELGPSLVAELRQRLEARRTDLERLIAQGRRDDAPIAPARLFAMPDSVLCLGCAGRSGDRP